MDSETPSSQTSPGEHAAASATAAPSPILEIREVTKVYGGVVAVKRSSLILYPGQITSLIGPNGAGKTTLFNCVTGTVPATSGAIVFHGTPGVRPEEIQNRRPDQIARLGIARTFQNIRLFASLSALDNVKIGFHTRTKARVFGALFRPPSTRAEERRVESSAIRYLEFCGLSGLENEFAGSLPYGLQRRLEIARALAVGPRLLLLDEPAAGMNPSESRDLLELIRKIVRSGVSIFLIEHDMRVVMTISDRIYVLDHGEVIASGLPQDICKDPRVVEAYLGKA